MENESSLLTFNSNKSPQHTVDEFNTFYTRLLDIYNSNFLEDFDISQKRNFLNKQWITMGIAKSCKVKNKLHSESIKHRGRAKEQETKNAFISYRAKLRDIIRQAKSDHFSKRFKNCKGDLKKCWKVLNEMRNKKRTYSFPNYIEFNKQLITDRRIIINKFNDYCLRVRGGIASKQRR